MGRGSASSGNRGGGTSTGAKTYFSGGYTFTTRPGIADKGYSVVFADTRKLDQAWQQDSAANYIAPGGAGQIDNRREQFGEFLKTGEAIQMSKLQIRDGGNVQFRDGRHRFSVLRDRGLKKIPVLVKDSQLRTAKSLLE